MTIFAVLLLTVLSFVFIVYPLFKRRAFLSASAGDEKARELHSKRDTTYSMLKELEFDFQSGILTEDDYRDLEARYKRKAISILKDSDELEKGSEAEEEIETRVRKLRRTKSVQLDDQVETEVQKLRRGKPAQANIAVGAGVQKVQSRGQFCSQCGTKSQPSDRFCSSCGAKLG